MKLEKLTIIGDAPHGCHLTRRIVLCRGHVLSWDVRTRFGEAEGKTSKKAGGFSRLMHDPKVAKSFGSGQEVFEISRVGSDRSKSQGSGWVVSDLTGRVGSGRPSPTRPARSGTPREELWKKYL